MFIELGIIHSNKCIFQKIITGMRECYDANKMVAFFSYFARNNI